MGIFNVLLQQEVTCSLHLRQNLNRSDYLQQFTCVMYVIQGWQQRKTAIRLNKTQNNAAALLTIRREVFFRNACFHHVVPKSNSSIQKRYTKLKKHEGYCLSYPTRVVGSREYKGISTAWNIKGGTPCHRSLSDTPGTLKAEHNKVVSTHCNYT